MPTSQQQKNRLRKKIVAADESDMNVLNPRMIIDHLRASKPVGTLDRLCSSLPRQVDLAEACTFYLEYLTTFAH